MMSEFARLGAEPIAANELAARKAVIIGGFGRSVETTAGLAGQYSALAQFGLPLEKLQTYSADINAVTADGRHSCEGLYDPANAPLSRGWRRRSVLGAGEGQARWHGAPADCQAEPTNSAGLK